MSIDGMQSRVIVGLYAFIETRPRWHLRETPAGYCEAGFLLWQYEVGKYQRISAKLAIWKSKPIKEVRS